MLKEGNEKHRQTLEQIGQAIELLEGQDELQLEELPFEKHPNTSISEVS